MREGVILVDGSVGDDAGLLMRRGLIAIQGTAGSGLARSMIAGTILALGDVGGRIGAGMKRGTVILPELHRPAEEILLPTFAWAGVIATPFLTLYYRQLAEWGFRVAPAVSSARLERYNGDLVVKGQGEVLVGRLVA
jgi:formylmethanofuran dehydrogenase subunit C